MPTLPVLSLTGIVVLLSLLSARAGAAPEAVLTLAEAEQLALEHAPWFAHHRSNVEAAAERAVYEGSLPDPQLTLGVVNLPTDTYRLNQDDMTMVSIGLRQQFPPGDTLKLRARRAEQELTREQARLEIERRALLKQVRQTWLELYYQRQASQVLADMRVLAQRQLAAAEDRYRAAQEPQQTLLKQRQMLARLDERELMLNAQQARLRAQLGRWIGPPAHRPLPAELPVLPPLPAEFETAQHPEVLAARAGLEAARAEVGIARQEYKPGIMLDVSYGARRATPDGQSRPDMVTALVTFDLPLFTARRQDRRVAEKQTLEAAARYESEDKHRELRAMYETMRAEHSALGARVKLLSERLLPDVQREARVSAAGFARDVGELREARQKEFDTQLELTRLRVDLARSHSELLYIIGENQP